MPESVLEFKRRYILLNIRDMKNEWYISEKFREKLRLWFLTVWFGTVLVVIKDKNDLSVTLLLAIETLIFFLFDVYYSGLNRYRIKPKWADDISAQLIWRYIKKIG